MSELDDKLFKIVSEVRFADVAQGRDYYIAKIKQAFQEAGYVQGVTGDLLEISIDRHEYVGANGRPNIPLMTGQEWYDRLIKQVDHTPVTWPDNSSNIYIQAVISDVWMKAAKRAAGIKEDD